MDRVPLKSFNQFWLYYLRAHANPKTRAIHYGAISLAFLGVVASIILSNAWIFPAAVVFGYLIAWSAHFTIENNKPVFLEYPLWSLRGGIRMYFFWLTGKLESELKKAGVE